jgi:hypothetical protein
LESELGWRSFGFYNYRNKNKREKEYSWNIIEFEYLEIFGNVFLSGVPGNISGLFLGRGLCWWKLFLPTLSHGTTVRRDPNGRNTVVF